MEELTPIFTLRDVGVALDGKQILSGLDLEIMKKRAAFVMGRSGAGKTTLLRIFNRLNDCFPGCVTTGEIALHLDDGIVRPYADDISMPELRRLVGMVFQHPNVLPLSIENNIVMPLATVHGVHRAAAREAAEQALREAHLWDEVRGRLASDARTLSGGQQQRLCLARTLAMKPRVLLLDEPTSSLDYRASKGIEDLLETLKHRYTLVVVSHSLDFALRLADEIIVLREGRTHRHILPRDLMGQSDTVIKELEAMY